MIVKPNIQAVLSVIGGFYAIMRIILYLIRFANLDETARVALAEALARKTEIDKIRDDLNRLMYERRGGDSTNLNVGNDLVGRNKSETHPKPEG